LSRRRGPGGGGQATANELSRRFDFGWGGPEIDFARPGELIAGDRTTGAVLQGPGVVGVGADGVHFVLNHTDEARSKVIGQSTGWVQWEDLRHLVYSGTDIAVHYEQFVYMGDDSSNYTAQMVLQARFPAAEDAQEFVRIGSRRQAEAR
jgi:hypothetical protein